MNTTEALIQAAVHKFRARRGEKTIWAGDKRMTVRTPGERTLYLPNGHAVKVTVDDSGCATQIEEDDALHAVARPNSISLQLRNPQ
jgi:hypothetical protein